MHIGQRIKEEMGRQNRSVVWLADQITCERTNVYNIFDRKDINTQLLQKISLALKYDFFKELSDETFHKKHTV